MVLVEGDLIEADALGLTDEPRIRSVAPPTQDEDESDSDAPGSADRSPLSPNAARRANERQRILDALERANWNKVRAAELLGMPRRTLYRRLKDYGLLD